MKFMLSLRDKAFQWLIDEAERRDTTVQEVLRAVILPEWHFANNGTVKQRVPFTATSTGVLRDSSSGRTTVRQAVDSGSTPESRTIHPTDGEFRDWDAEEREKREKQE